VLTTLLELLGRAGKWDEALPLIDEMQAQKLLTDAEARYKKAVLLHMTATKLAEQDRASEALAQARRAAKLAPAFAPGVVQAAELALQAGRRRVALQLLEDSWRVEPHPDVARVYAQVDPAETASQRMKRIDTRLAPLNRENIETIVLQAEVAMQAGDWDAARARLEAALDAGPTARVYRLLAELERQSRGDQAKAQEWLGRATDAAPDRAWVCDDTGEVLPSWRPVAPSGRFDAVHWATPPKVATLMGTEQTTYILTHEDAPAFAATGTAKAAAAAG
jgi:HemY protein